MNKFTLDQRMFFKLFVLIAIFAFSPAKGAETATWVAVFGEDTERRWWTLFKMRPLSPEWEEVDGFGVAWRLLADVFPAKTPIITRSTVRSPEHPYVKFDKGDTSHPEIVLRKLAHALGQNGSRNVSLRLELPFRYYDRKASFVYVLKDPVVCINGNGVDGSALLLKVTRSAIVNCIENSANENIKDITSKLTELELAEFWKNDLLSSVKIDSLSISYSLGIIVIHLSEDEENALFDFCESALSGPRR